MSRSSLRLVVLAVLVFASPASAQIIGRPIEVSGQLGWSAPDARAHVKSGLALGGSVGMRMLPWLVIEGQAYMAPSKADTVPEQSHDFRSIGVDFRVNIRPADERVVPYVMYGLAAGNSSTTGTPPDDLSRGTPSLAVGTLINLRNQRSYLRLQIRDSFFRQRDAKEFDNDFVLTAGLHWVFGGKEKDTDLDGVREWLDACPGTPIGAKVDAKGCALDADRDSVPEGLDQCANTPAGCKVDAKGCPIDSDGDGVCDGVDTCPDTPNRNVGRRARLSQRHRRRRRDHAHRSVRGHAQGCGGGREGLPQGRRRRRRLRWSRPVRQTPPAVSRSTRRDARPK
jgi:hypothetical protein